MIGDFPFYRVLEKIIFARQVAQSPLLWALRFITVFARSRPISRSKWTKPRARYPISLTWILILSFHLRQGLPYGFFYSGFPTKTCTHLSFPRLTCMSLKSWPNWGDHLNKVLGWVQIMKFFIVQSSESFSFYIKIFFTAIIFIHSYSCCSLWSIGHPWNDSLHFSFLIFIYSR
jgi:hypothetical protein